MILTDDEKKLLVEYRRYKKQKNNEMVNVFINAYIKENPLHKMKVDKTNNHYKRFIAYLSDDSTLEEVAKMLGCSTTTVRHSFIKYGRKLIGREKFDTEIWTNGLPDIKKHKDLFMSIIES